MSVVEEPLLIEGVDVSEEVESTVRFVLAK
jgi:hypothetical protein